jgi:hypothetical protein
LPRRLDPFIELRLGGFSGRVIDQCPRQTDNDHSKHGCAKKVSEEHGDRAALHRRPRSNHPSFSSMGHRPQFRGGALFLS